ncbi:D-alanine--D-alanine ligase B [Limihaloglobus sulfuriphilus]|uniref:D-alanine--D-alanine ligase n=1 Tax=Limihaloglobus sulfuriphilus TaxID=1851148 RepID=A0A1Q2MEX0_9BACT|nr:D-alanine--D-alanine ligase [Limihaloglobus sulfuriphilus]AQQ71220.1 D-alanine--D-alanine ligase B [Limihaloglobus sulfuriphilus]
MSETSLKIAVLMGGIGSEREISLLTGKNIAAALRSEGMTVVEADVTPEKLDILTDKTIDVFFPALHGHWGEDGGIQKILEQRGLVYTGSSAEASEIAFDKLRSIELFRNAGLQAPAGFEVNSRTDLAELEEELDSKSGKYVVKPVRDGSSVGIEIRTGKQAAIRSAADRLEKFGSLMIEDFIPGREITVGVVNEHVLPVLEIIAKAGFYDYESKYISDQTEYVFDTIKDPELVKRIEHDARVCYEAVGAKDAARADFILSDDNVPYVLEINTSPGFTSHSLVPKAAAHIGLSQGRLCREIIEAAIARHVKS